MIGQKLIKTLIIFFMILITLLSGCTGSEGGYPSISTVNFNLFSSALYNEEGDNTTIQLTVENHDSVMIEVVNSTVIADFNKVYQIKITGITEIQPGESQVINITFRGNRTKNIVRIEIIVDKEGILYIKGKDY